MYSKKLVVSLALFMILASCTKPTPIIPKYKSGDLVQLVGTKELAQIIRVIYYDTYSVRVSTIMGPKELCVFEFEIANLVEVK